MNIQSTETVEMRKERKVTPIWDKLNCVSCYTFSSIWILERRIINEKCGDYNIHDISKEYNVWCSNDN